MITRSALTIALFALAVETAVASAEAAPSQKIAVLDATGEDAWGRLPLTRSIRRVLSSGAVVVDEKPMEGRLPDIGTAVRSGKLEGIAVAGRAIGADYVLVVDITKRRWLYTAQALLLDAHTSEIRMDFRAGYYKPEEEAEDRGFRIAKKTLERLATLAPIALPPPPPPPEVTTATSAEPPPITDDFDDDLERELAAVQVEPELDSFETGSWRWSVRGWLGTSYYAFLHPDVEPSSERHFLKLGLRSTLTGETGPFRVRVLPLVEVNVLDRSLHRVVLEEGFGEVEIGPFELRLGWDARAWKTATTYSVVDILNTRDFTEGFIDQPKIGQPLVSVRFLFGNHSITAMYLSPFIPANLPNAGSVFSPVERPASRAEPIVLYGTDLDEFHPQAAARLALAFQGFDLGLTYLYGYRRLPFFVPPGVVFHPIVHYAGIDGQVLVSKVALRWEVLGLLHQKTARSENPGITVPTPMGDLPLPRIELPGPRLQTVIGVDVTLDELIGRTTLIPFVELLGSSDSRWFRDERPPDGITQFFENHLAAGFSWNFENRVGSTLKSAVIIDLRSPTNTLLSLRYEERWFEILTFEIEGRWIFAAGDTAYSGIEELSGVLTNLRMYY